MKRNARGSQKKYCILFRYIVYLYNAKRNGKGIEILRKRVYDWYAGHWKRMGCGNIRQIYWFGNGLWRYIRCMCVKKYIKKEKGSWDEDESVY